MRRRSGGVNRPAEKIARQRIIAKWKIGITLPIRSGHPRPSAQYPVRKPAGRGSPQGVTHAVSSHPFPKDAVLQPQDATVSLRSTLLHRRGRNLQKPRKIVTRADDPQKSIGNRHYYWERRAAVVSAVKDGDAVLLQRQYGSRGAIPPHGRTRPHPQIIGSVQLVQPQRRGESAPRGTVQPGAHPQTNNQAIHAIRRRTQL